MNLILQAIKSMFRKVNMMFNQLSNKVEIAQTNAVEAKALAEKQSDWNQNDETAPDYIKNKPFGDIGETHLLAESKLPDHDSSYCGLPYHKFESDASYYLRIDGVDYQGFIRDGYNTLDFYHSDETRIGALFSPEDDPTSLELNLNYSYFNITIPLTFELIEVKCQKIDSKFLHVPDWNQNDENAPDYIKNKPFYEIEKREVLVEEITFNVVNGRAEGILDFFNANVGDTLVVTFDGVEYESVMTIDGDACYWLIFDTPQGRVEIYDYDTVYFDNDGNHTLKIEKNLGTLKKIDGKFLYNADWNQNGSNEPDYVKNRTHYIDADGNYVPLNERYIPDSIARSSAVNGINSRIDDASSVVASPASYFKVDHYNGIITDLTTEGETATNIVIPSKIGETDITILEHESLAFTENLVSVIIPNSVNIIVGSAFARCTNLTNVTIPNSVTSIGGYAFEYCAKLTNITIPKGVTIIAVDTFKECTGLTNIDLPDGLVTIQDSAFQHCTSLTNIDLPKDLKQICEYAFSGCSGLTSINIPSKVVYIGKHAFRYCTNLNTIIIPRSVNNIAYCTFFNCSNLTTVYYEGTEEEWNAITIDDGNDELINATKVFNYGTPIQKLPVVDSDDAGKSLQVSETGEWIVEENESNSIIDVIELPTENIDENVFYRLFTAEMTGKNAYMYHCYIVNELPETGCYYDTTRSKIVLYYNLGDGELYMYSEETAVNKTGLSIGWHTIEEFYELMNYTWGGILTDSNEADNSDMTHRLLLMYNIWYHKDGQWITTKSMCKEEAEAGSVAFNTYYNKALGQYSLAHGFNTHAEGRGSHAEGCGSHAEGDYSHTEGYKSYSEGYGSHAEGVETYAQGNYSHTEGYLTYAKDWHTHAEGCGTVAGCKNQHVQGQYNIIDPEYVKDNNLKLGQYAHIVGNGTADDARSNAHTLDWNGLAWFAGGLKVGGAGQDDENAKEVALKEDIAPAVEEAVAGIKDDLVSDVLSALPMWEGGNY